MGNSTWGHKEADMTECVRVHTHTHIRPIMPGKKKSKGPENSLKVQRKKKRKGQTALFRVWE